MRIFSAIGQVAVFEWSSAIKSRRALVIILLYLVAAVSCMNGTISLLGKMETELKTVLQLPASSETGIVSEALWKSKPFQRMVSKSVGNGAAYDDLAKRHPVELLYAWFVFMCAPLLVMLVSSTRAADDLKSGAVRYLIVRVSRGEWTLGKYAGQAMMLAIALLVSALGAWIVTLCRLPGATAVRLLTPLLGWGMKAWIYTLAWLGLALGISHMTRSPARATAFGIIAVALFTALPALFDALHTHAHWPAALTHIRMLVPRGAEMKLWRTAAAPFTAGVFHLLILSFTYLSLGAATFARRDA